MTEAVVEAAAVEAAEAVEAEAEAAEMVAEAVVVTGAMDARLNEAGRSRHSTAAAANDCRRSFARD
jgi:hypothetical protein